MLIDSTGNLNFSVHIAKVVSKAHAQTCLMHKCFLSRDPATSTARVLLQCGLLI